MAKPSLKLSQQGQKLTHDAFTKKGFTQESLAATLGCNRSVISKFFNGENVWEKYFTSICDSLGINYKEVSYGYIPPEVKYSVDKVRNKVRELTQELCGTMRILDMTQPIELSHIYTDVNILEKLTSLRRRTIDDLLEECGYDDFDRFGLGKVVEKQIFGTQAVEKYKKLIVLGKPGAGKTTFLRYLAIQCNQESFLSNLVPIFIPLKYFAEDPNRPSLLEYISQQYSGCDVTQEELTELFKQGSALILFDGLDEVINEYQEYTLKEVRSFSRIYFENHFVIACRIAAWEYTFDKFTEVEIADFDDKQIHEFANNWFKNKEVKSEDFIRRLKQNNRVYQLAVTPLLLTLLCIVFEVSGTLPHNRSESYHEGLDVLLKKWDAKRGINRDPIYKNLSLKRKKDLLRQIAHSTFEKEKYFFTLLEIKGIITNFISKVLNQDDDLNISQENVEKLLKSMEYQHGIIIERAKGIYSFSHLTFHEYFVAKRIVSLIPQKEEDYKIDDFQNDKLLDYQESQRIKELKKLTKHLTNYKWREVFLLVSELLFDTSDLFKLMKEKADNILNGKENLQSYVKNANKNYESMLRLFTINSNLETKKFKAALRAFFFDIDYDIDPERRLCFLLEPRTKYLTCANCFIRICKDVNSLEEGVILAQEYDTNTIDSDFKIINAKSNDQIVKIAVNYSIETNRVMRYKDELEEIKNIFFKEETFEKDKLKYGANEVRRIARKKLLAHQLLGVSFKDFSTEDQETLKDYYYANNLLIDCLLQTDCVTSSQLRSEIFETLFLQ